VAIKGKTKSRGAKAVTRGPKPTYVPVKPRLLARRGLWITVASILGILAVAGIAYGVVEERRGSREQDLLEARVQAIGEFGRAVEPVIGTVGEPVPPASWSSFTELHDALDRLEAGEGRPPLIADTATDAASVAGTAWSALDGVNAVGIVSDRGLDREFVLYVLNAKTKLVGALKLYEQGAELVVMAANEPQAAASDALVERAAGVLDVARTLFDDGYSDYVEAQAAAELFEPVTSLPSATGPTG
jgi:hypothetical protein